ncbi:hypothetical protein VIGAN_01181900 [Vigna angularis var. angularis]|uniref:Uncharacterized protein n=1 Tax=Vigna angularis var. angularis TaxID=157739 RepID=A0A0S3R0X8_PHAAN|nr:hypothetical protein VIGAN_01181900 [Vigna angularis var. angularis]
MQKTKSTSITLHPWVPLSAGPMMFLVVADACLKSGRVKVAGRTKPAAAAGGERRQCAGPWVFQPLHGSFPCCSTFC